VFLPIVALAGAVVAAAALPVLAGPEALRENAALCLRSRQEGADELLQGVPTAATPYASVSARQECGDLAAAPTRVGATRRGRYPADQNGNRTVQLSPNLTREEGTEDGRAPGSQVAQVAKAVAGTAASVTSVRTFDSARYQPGGTLDVTVQITGTSTGAISGMAVEEILPAGWTVVSVLGMSFPPIGPPPGATGTLQFGWIVVPREWPVTLTYRVSIPETDHGTKTFTGRVLYREDAGDIPVTTPATQIEGLYTVRFLAAAPSYITGEVTQLVAQGGDAEPVEAHAGPSLAFIGWTDGVATARRGLTDVLANRDVTAQFRAADVTSIRTFGSARYQPGDTLDVSLRLESASAGAITSLALEEALPTGWTFVGVLSSPAPGLVPSPGDTGTLLFSWSTIPEVWPVTLTYRVSIPETEHGIMTFTGQVLFREDAGDIPVTTPATQIEGLYTVRFLAAAPSYLTGEVTQLVPQGGDAAVVEAHAGYPLVFTGWSDGVLTASRGLTNVLANQDLTAQFRAAAEVDLYTGEGTAMVLAPDVLAGHGIWDVTGPYSVALGVGTLSLDVVHSPDGRIGGQATLALPTKAVALSVPIMGTVTGANGEVRAKIIVKGAHSTGSARLALTMLLTVNAAADPAQLVGSVVGSVTLASRTTSVDSGLVLNIPEPMDGTWSLDFGMMPYDESAVGIAVLTLSNGAEYTYQFTGRTEGRTAVLRLGAAPEDPAARSIRISTAVIMLENDWIRLVSFWACAYGQTIGW